METVEGPAEAFGADGGGGVEGEDGDLLVGEGAEGACAAEGAEAAVVGEHLDVGAGVLLGEGDEVGDVAQRVVLAAARGAENLKVESGERRVENGERRTEMLLIGFGAAYAMKKRKEA